jgi:GMP synthase (glutamine-hydrolysing)
VQEIGWRQVSLTPQGMQDPLFAGLSPALRVLQWHGDTFAIPAGGRLLATGPEVPHQAFAWGRAYGLQFHVEADPEMVRAWFPHSPDQETMLGPFALEGAALEAQARAVFKNFLALAAARADGRGPAL